MVALRLRVLRAALSSLVGGLYLGPLFAYFVREPLVPAKEVLFGKDANEISNYVAVRFATDIARIGKRFAITALVLGAALGLVAHAFLAVRDWLHDRHRPRHLALHLASVLALVVVVHGALFAASMSRWPQLYTELFWSQGGRLADVQRVVVDEIGTRRLVIAYAAAAAAFFLGGPRTWRVLVARVRAASPSAWVQVLAAVATGMAAPFALETTQRRPPVEVPIARPKRSPSVLVLAADGLRPDRLRAPIAPNLAREADRGVRFENAYTALPRTFESWTSILTGRYPHHHGIRTSFPRWEEVSAPLPTLPQRLHEEGWTTAAVSDYAGDIFGQANYGFSYLDVPPVSFIRLLEQLAVQRSGPLLPFLQTNPGRAMFPAIRLWAGAADPEFVADDAVAALHAMQDDRPFCLVVFFSTTHFPYAAPAPYHRRWSSPAYRGPFRYDKTVPAVVTEKPDDADVAQVRALYDGAVSAVDDAAGRILDELARLHLEDDTIVVITSDHGETLFENGRWHGHGDHLLGDESTHIPLAIYDPRLNGHARVERSVVSSVDIAPTLHDLVGVPPRAPMDGRSLAAALRGEPLEPRPAFVEAGVHLVEHPGIAPELHFPAVGFKKLLEVDAEHGYGVVVQRDQLVPIVRTRHRMIRDDHWKLLYMPTPKGVVYRLFDVERDPQEQSDLYAAEPVVAERLRDRLWAWMLEDPLVVREGDMLAPRAAP